MPTDAGSLVKPSDNHKVLPLGEKVKYLIKFVMILQWEKICETVKMQKEICVNMLLYL